MPSLSKEWEELPTETVIPSARNEHGCGRSKEIVKTTHLLSGIIPVEVENPEYAVRVLASAVGGLALLTMDNYKAKHQMTFSAFRRLLNPAYEYLITLVKKNDSLLTNKHDAKAKYLHSLSVDFHPTEAFIGVRVTYQDNDYVRTYRFRIAPKDNSHMAKIPSLARPDDKPHQKLQPKM